MEQCVTSFPEQSHRENVWVGEIFFEIFSDGGVLPTGSSLKLFSTYFFNPRFIIFNCQKRSCVSHDRTIFTVMKERNSGLLVRATLRDLLEIFF